MLMRAYGIEPVIGSQNNFADAGNTYYAGYLAKAKETGISAGIGNNLFVPDKQITRQEMFTLLYNSLKEIEQLPEENSSKKLADFSDTGQIASWSQESMTSLVKNGIVSGDDDKLTLIGTVTGAETA